MVLGRFVLLLLQVISILAMILGPLITYATWERETYLHKMQSEGIETKAGITSAGVKEKPGSASLESIYFDIAWTDRQGKVHKVEHVQASLQYGMQFLTPVKPTDTKDAFAAAYALTVKEAPLKYLAADPRQFILSADPRNSEYHRGWAAPLAVSVIGLAVFLALVRVQLRRKALAAAKPGGITPEEIAAEKRLNLQLGWLFASLVFYGFLVGAHFTAGAHATDIKYFGATPFGLPVTLVAVAIGTVLYLPLIWVQWHVMRLAFQAREDHGMLARFYLPLYIVTAGGHAPLRNSRNAVWLGILYVLALLAAWIAYTKMKGI